MSFTGRLPKNQRPKKKAVKASRLPKNYISLAEQQEARLSGTEINELALSFFDGKFSVTDIFDVGCIYFLFFEGQIVYIGQTKNIFERISKHYRSKKMIFDKFKLMKFNGSDRQRLAKETSLIFKHKPKYNETAKERTNKDAMDCRIVSMREGRSR